jgi:hypothetical protein
MKFASYPARKASDCAVKAEQAGLTVGIQPIKDINEQKAYFNADLTQEGYIPVYIVLENRSTEDSFIFDKTALQVGAFDASVSVPNTSQQMTLQTTCPPGSIEYVQPGLQPGCIQEQQMRPGEAERRAEAGGTPKHPEPGPPGKKPEPGPPGKNPEPAPRTNRAEARAQGSNSKPARGIYVPSNAPNVGGVAFASVELASIIVDQMRLNHGLFIHQYMIKNEIQSNTISPGKSVSGFLYIPVPRQGSEPMTRLLIPFTRAGTDETLTMSLDF